MLATSFASSDYLLSDRYEALIRVSQAIGAHRDPQDLFRAMATELRRVIQFDGIVVAQYDEAVSYTHLDVYKRQLFALRRTLILASRYAECQAR